VNAYLLLKAVHILSSVLMVGTGLGSAFYMFFTLRSRDVAALSVVSRLVVRADWWFTTPTVFVQPASGLLLAHMAGWPLSTPWLAISLGLFVFAGLCWLPVVWLQLRMAELARRSSAMQEELPPLFWHYAWWWERLGYPAFIAMLLIFYLMVNKPALA
jgi:uncharacterized membrane protein